MSLLLTRPGHSLDFLCVRGNHGRKDESDAHHSAGNDPSYLRPPLDVGREPHLILGRRPGGGSGMQGRRSRPPSRAKNLWSASSKLANVARLYEAPPRLDGLVFDRSNNDRQLARSGLRGEPSHDKNLPRALDRRFCLACGHAVGDGIYVSDLVRPGETVSLGKALYARSGAQVAGQTSRGSATIDLTQGRSMRERSHAIVTSLTSFDFRRLRKRRRCWSAGAATTSVCWFDSRFLHNRNARPRRHRRTGNPYDFPITPPLRPSRFPMSGLASSRYRVCQRAYSRCSAADEDLRREGMAPLPRRRSVDKTHRRHATADSYGKRMRA
jgi:hypothetical protein